jgi:hypothetical protein
VIKALIISGSMGSGKTTVLGEASDILAARGIAHAALDIDALGVVGVSDAVARDLMRRNLAAVMENYARAAIDRFLIAEALESVADRERLGVALGSAEIVVCRLRASLATMQARVRLREPGSLQDEFVIRAATLDAALDAAAVEDFTVDNDNRSITDVAREMLLLAGWIHA